MTEPDQEKECTCRRMAVELRPCLFCRQVNDAIREGAVLTYKIPDAPTHTFKIFRPEPTE